MIAVERGFTSRSFYPGSVPASPAEAERERLISGSKVRVLDGPPNESATSGTSGVADLLATAVRPAYTCAPRPLRRSRRASLEGNRACLALEASSRKTSAGQLQSSACCHGEWLRQPVLDRRPEPIHEWGAPGSSGRTSSVVRSRSSARFVWSWSPSRAATRALADGGHPHARVWTGEHATIGSAPRKP